MIHGTERFAACFTDCRGVFGTMPRETNQQARRRIAWKWIEDQWELWPRPDLQDAIFNPRVISVRKIWR